MKKYKLSDIRIRDPFFLKRGEYYYLYGTTDYNNWAGLGVGFDFYKSHDLEWFEGPYPAFRPPKDFWADRNFWAPEVWKHKGKYYMIASFKSEEKCRGVQVLWSYSPEGPFEPLINQPVTPARWECLDGTLVLGKEVYLVFCHEWLQTGDGEICALQLSDDLKYPIGDPKVLFRASEARWTVLHEEFGHSGYITDGPFVIKNGYKGYYMLWSSYGKNGYAIGISHTTDGLAGTWQHDDIPLINQDGGHGMVFEGLLGEKLLAIHAPNGWMKERIQLYKLDKLQ